MYVYVCTHGRLEVTDFIPGHLQDNVVVAADSKRVPEALFLDIKR